MNNDTRLMMIAAGVLALFLAFLMLEIYHLNVMMSQQIRDRQAVIFKLQDQYTTIERRLQAIQDDTHIKGIFLRR